VAWLCTEPFHINTEHPSRVATNVRRLEFKVSIPLVNLANNAIQITRVALGQADKPNKCPLLPAKSTT
jgi:hypothetical protein